MGGKSNDTKASTIPQSLRRRAERILSTSPTDVANMGRDEVQRLVHELQVHHIELELQNEELRQAQLQLAESRDQYADLYELAPVGYVMLNRDGKILSANLTAATMLGVEQSALMRSNFSGFVGPGSWDGFFFHRRDVFSSNTKQTVELEMHKADGTPLVVRLESIAVDEPDGGRCRTALLDVTECKQAEEQLGQLNETLEQRIAERTAALREAEERFREIFEHAAEGIAITDWQGRYIQYNAVYCAITGYTEQELSAMRFEPLIHPDDRAHSMDLMRRLMDGELSSFEVENRYLTKSGAPVWVHNHVSILRNDQGVPTHLMVLATDITQRKRDEEALRQQRTRLEDLALQLLLAQEQERRRIAGDLHDDFTQRLAALAIDLRSLASLAAKSGMSFSRQLQEAGEAAEQLTTELQRLAHYLHPSILEHVGLEAAAREHVEDFETRTGLEANVEVRNLPTALSLDQATCLYRVLQESLQNVRKHANATKVLVRLLGTTRGVGLCVHDDGRGFDFVREVSQERRGLGIISLQERVGALHGMFRVKTKPGDGTEVHAWIPLDQCAVSTKIGA